MLPFREARIELAGQCRMIEGLVDQRDNDQLRLISRCEHECSAFTISDCQDSTYQELCLDCGLRICYSRIFPNPAEVNFQQFLIIREVLDIPVVTLTTAIGAVLDRFSKKEDTASSGTSAG